MTGRDQSSAGTLARTTLAGRPLPEALLQAFLRTHYTALAPFGPVEIRIGCLHPRLDRFLAEHGLRGWVYIGACNPLAERLDEARNTQLHARFGRLLVRLQRPGWSGHGVAEGKDWPPEPSWLVPGLDAALARRLALRYGQLAYVCADLGGPAVLRFSGLSLR